MHIKKLLVALCTALILSTASHADAPLKSSLGLDVDQARQVQEIQKEFRAKFRSKRQVYNRESRKLRRARSENDSAVIAQQEKITAGLREELRQIRNAENQAIRGVLTPAQSEKFAAVIAQRRASVGSSRDADIFKD